MKTMHNAPFIMHNAQCTMHNWLRRNVLRQVLLLIVFFTLHSSLFTLQAQTVGEAFYIYRNDGGFNAFFRDEVDSITYSHYDTDSIFYDEIVTQLVYTADSVYKIPLAAVDSVGFVQPETVYEENTTELSGLILDYIVSVDNFTIYLQLDTPEELIPEIGQKLAQLEFSDFFPDGFVGEVSSVVKEDDQIVVVCTGLPLDDVVTQFCGVYRLTAIGDPETSRFRLRRAAGHTIYERTLPGGNIPIHVSLSWLDIWKDQQFLEGLQYGANGDLSIDIHPTFDIKVTYYKNDLLGIIPRYNAHVFTDFSITEELQLMGTIEGEKKYPWKLPFGLEKLKDYPIVPGTVTFYLDAGMKASGKGNLGIGAVFHQTGNHVLDVNFYPIPRLVGPLPFMPVSTLTHSASMTSHDEDWIYVVGDFEAKVGPYLELGFGFINHKVSKIGAEFDGGLKFKGSIKFNTVDWQTAESCTDFYDGCVSDSKVAVNAYIGSYGILAAFDERLKFSVGNDVDLQNLFHRESSLLPSFTNVKLEHQPTNYSALTASANIHDNCIFPLQLGFALFNEDDTKVQGLHYEGSKYWTQNSFSSYLVNFENITSEGKYTAYPTVSLFGKDILASPCADLEGETTCPDENHPHWINLGLPSGTQWRCCNEGASSPEAYGGYYTFGQVSSAPTLDQMEEMLNNCSCEWTTQNGVDGWKFIGPNGGTIFLPAAGCVLDGELNSVGTCGYYWSSTPLNDDYSYELYFYFGGVGCIYDLFLGCEQSVRPVR